MTWNNTCIYTIWPFWLEWLWCAKNFVHHLVYYNLTFQISLASSVYIISMHTQIFFHVWFNQCRCVIFISLKIFHLMFEGKQDLPRFEPYQFMVHKNLSIMYWHSMKTILKQLFFLEVLILPSINIFKHFHSKKHQCAQFILVCWFHLCKKTSFIILYLTQYLKFACKDSWITSSTIFQYFCLKFLFFHCPIIKTFEINVKKKVPRFLKKYVSTRVYNGKNPSIQNVSEHPEQFNIKIQVPLSCVHTY